MRTIKFRCWVSNGSVNAMCYTWERGSAIDSTFHRRLNIWDKRKYKPAKWENEIIFMQFTGLLDRNNVEIYEGDILKSDKTNYEVYWDKDDAHFSPLSEHISNRRSEVIGNKFENKDLLK